MKERVRIFLKRTIDWLKRLDSKLQSQEQDKLPYNSLSPIDDLDIENDYKKSLNWALNNRKKLDIKNIALTGPFGSGKSSILKTYVANCERKDLHFLNISLATFKEEEENKRTIPKDDMLRLIELSILQQIFYHEEDRNIPDSRFRKIKNYTKRNLLITTMTLFFLIVSTIHIIYPQVIESLLKIEFDPRTSDILHYTSLIFINVAVFAFIYKSIRTINGIKINKLNIQNAEIGINENSNKSILNHHIDEILYFFEVTNYNVVIIEDLDRFKQTEIFTKLREINLLVNNSKKIKKDIVFIYAVRDDMFKEENERTKFFDFIIPVIPVINPSNSSQKLLEKQTLNNYKISENLIDSISLFIDDMRLLHNISNEFYLYQQKLNKSLSQDKLLSVIVYKNIFPNDFTLLSNNKGVLFTAINNKQKYITDETLRINIEIKTVKEEIYELENLKIKDIKELRYMYLLFYIPNLSGFVSFNIEGTNQPPSGMASDTNFDYLISNKAQYRYLHSSSQYIKPIPTPFNQIEKEVDSEHTYSERKEQIEDWTSNKVEALKKKIQELEKSKSQIRNLRVRELLQQSQIEIEIDDVKQKNLISLLLRNGFIDEDYLDYVSIFYEGSITKSDHQFLINVKSRAHTEFNYKLNKIDKLINKINPLEFDKDYTLNYALLDFVLNDPNYKAIRETIFTKLNDESEMSIKFIDSFIETTPNIQVFIIHLISSWINIWPFLENKSNFTKARKDIYFKLIIEYAEVDDIRKLYYNPFFKKSLLQKRDFLNIIPNIEKVKDVVKSLNIKFTDLDLNEIPLELLEYIYNGDFYEINEGMIRLILKAKDKYKVIDFDTKNYSAIIKSECDPLIKYLQANLNKYIVEVYLRLETNNNEDPNCLVALLNSGNIHIENKAKIVKQVKTIVNDLSSIGDLEVAKIMLEESKISPTWGNIFNYYERDENRISESIAVFLGVKENAFELSKTKIKKDIDEEIKYTTFISNLVTTESINNEIYKILLKSVPYRFSDLDFSTLSEEKVSLLQTNGILTFNVENYKLLKKTFKYLHIQFLEFNKSDFIKNILGYELNPLDILLLLKSGRISMSEKNTILETIEEGFFSSDINTLKAIGELILKDNSFRVTDAILKLIIVNNSLSIEQRIRIFNWKHNQISNDYIDIFLNSLLEPYSEITVKGKRPVIKNTEYNQKFVEILDSKNYISKFDNEEKGIRISTYKKDSE